MTSKADKGARAQRARNELLDELRKPRERMRGLSPPPRVMMKGAPVRVRSEFGGSRFGGLEGKVHRIGDGTARDPANWVHVAFGARVLNPRNHIPFRAEELETAA